MKTIKPPSELIGRFFHSFTLAGGISWQGHVIAQVGPSHYLVALFDWVTGDESTDRVVDLDDMTRWTFYRTVDEMKDARERLRGM